MRIFRDREFKRFSPDADSGSLFSDVHFEGCTFQSCSVGIAHTPDLRTTVRNIRFVNCDEYACFVQSPIVEDVVVDGFKTHGDTLLTFGAVFKHVVLQGKIDFLMTNEVLSPSDEMTEEQQAFNQANVDYYRDVDWALDIRQGEFKDIELRGVPGRLIRRDPETQALVTRQALLEGNWRKLEFHANVTTLAIGMFLERDEPDYVVVAPKRDNTFRERLADIELLRRAGIAEPD
ncbi:MAG: hypothetical protein HY288_18485 [Planctomycetia bacterium]|nr:hypothetical protein [Planctomycetia bacterium]